MFLHLSEAYCLSAYHYWHFCIRCIIFKKGFFSKVYRLPSIVPYEYKNEMSCDSITQKTDEDVQRHLQAAEQLADEDQSYRAAISVVTDELKIAYERFKTLMSDYEVLLAMCATFFASVDKVFSLL
jgi:hypothetical protein